MVQQQPPPGLLNISDLAPAPAAPTCIRRPSHHPAPAAPPTTPASHARYGPQICAALCRRQGSREALIIVIIFVPLRGAVVVPERRGRQASASWAGASVKTQSVNMDIDVNTGGCEESGRREGEARCSHLQMESHTYRQWQARS